MSKKLKLPLLFILGFLLLSFGSSPIFAEDVYWSTPEKINTSNNNAITPVFTTTPNGYLHSAWMELNKTGTGSEFWDGLNPGIFYSYWNGDAWSPPVKVSQNTDWAGFPAIASTSDGKIHVFYEDDSPDGSLGKIYYRNTADSGQNWSDPIVISTTTLYWSWAPQAVASSTDNLHVIYNDDSGDYDFLYTKCTGSCETAANWSTPVKISTTANNQHAAITVDSSDIPHVLLWDTNNLSGWPDGGIYYTYYDSGGGSWTTPTLISETGFFPRIICDTSDQLHAAWVTPNPGLPQDKVEYTKYEAPNWTSPYTVSENVDYSGWGMPFIGLTYDSDDNVYVGWGERVGTWPDFTVDASYRRWNGSTWSDPFFLRNVEDMDTAFIYRDKWDNQHMAWSEYNSAADEWQFWYSTIPVNVKDYNPQAAFNLYLNITDDLLSIPPNATTTATLISAQVGPLPASYDPQFTTLPRSYTFRPHGTTFIAGKEAEAKIYYEDLEVIGSDEANMKVYIWDSSQNAWSTSFTTSVQTNKNEITVTLPHFSLFGIAAPKVQVGWLPPISKADLYELKDGSTLPVKFTLSHFDGTPVGTPELAEDVIVKVKDKSEAFSEQYIFGTSRDDVRYDPTTNQYIVNIHTKELDLEKGLYVIEVFIFGQGQPVQEPIEFQIVEKGKVKGTTTP